MPGEGWGQFCKAIRHQYVPRLQQRPGTSIWPMVVTKPCCFRATDSSVALSGSAGPGPHHGPRWHCQLLASGCSSPFSISSSASLHYAHILLLLFFHHLLNLVAPRASEYLGLSQECYVSPVPWHQAGVMSGVLRLQGTR